MAWIYHQSTGVLEHRGKVIETGYSGYPPHKNDPSAEFLEALGPIPKGTYTIGQPYNHPDLGILTMNLTPKLGQKMGRRSAFRIHGDSKKHPGLASHGCIILSFKTRELIADDYDKELVVCL